MKKKASITDKTAFVVGNGPSLSAFNFQELEGYIWVGMNAAYRHWERSHIYPSYYACLDEVVGLSHGNAICKLVKNSQSNGIKSFLLRKNLIRRYPILQTHPKICCYEDLFSNIPKRVRDLVTTGSHSALWLSTLGYDQIVLLGIDANYVEKIDIAKAQKDKTFKVVKTGVNPNYYFKDYQKTGDAFMVPNPVPGVHTGAWTRVAQHLSRTAPEVTLLNGTSVSQVDCIPFIDIASFLKSDSDIIDPRKKFSDPERKQHRQAHITVPETSKFSLPKFLDQITPPKYHQFTGPKKGHGDLSPLGWTRVKISKLRSQWGLTFYPEGIFSNLEPNVHPESAIVVVNSKPAKDMSKVINKMQQDYDTVLLVSEFQGKIFITPATSGLDVTPTSVIAFKRERFSHTDIQKALEAAVSNKTRGKYKSYRRVYKQLITLKNIVKTLQKKRGS